MKQDSREDLMQNKIQNITKEELQKTQVLNLADVRETVKYEKSISRKPAFIIGLVGILLICLGSSLMVVDFLKEKKSNKDNNIQYREKVSENDKKLHESAIDCTLKELNRPDQTDTVYSLQFNFYDEKLANYTKTYTVNPTSTNPTPQVTIDNYNALFQPYLKDIKGYKVSSKQLANGITLITIIDLEELDLKILPPEQANLLAVAVDFNAKQTKTDILNKLVFEGYACK